MSDSDWSSDGDDAGAMAPPVAAASDPAPAATPAATPDAPAAASPAATVPAKEQAAPAASEQAADPNQPAIVLAQSVQLFKYVSGAAQPQGVAGCSILAWPGTPKRALLVYDAQRRTVCTATIWAGFQFTVQNGVYGTFTDDHQKVRWSLLFNSSETADKFAVHVCIAKFQSVGDARAVTVVELAAGDGDTPSARRDGMSLKFQAWRLPEDPVKPLSDDPAKASTDGDEDSYVPLILPKAPEPLKGLGSSLQGKVQGCRMVLTLDSSNDEAEVLGSDGGALVLLVEVMSVDKKGSKTKKLKKERGRRKKKEEKREQRNKEKEEAEAKARAEQEAKEAEAKKIAEQRAAERAQLAGVMDGLKEIYTLARGTTDFIKKRGLKDTMQVMSALYEACEEYFAADGAFSGEQVHEGVKGLLRKSQQQAKTVLQNEARDEIAQQFAGKLATLKDEVEKLVKEFRSEIAQAKEEGGPAIQEQLQAAKDEVAGMMTTVESLMERIEKAETERDAAVAAGKEKADVSKDELVRLKDQIRQYEAVADDFAKRVKEATSDADKYKRRIKQLEREQADLLKAQKGHKLTWVPDNVVPECLKCRAKFGKFKWRHHCRYCGRVFCANCASSKRTIPALGYNDAVRVCDGCTTILATAGIGDAGNVSASDDDDDYPMSGGGGGGGGGGGFDDSGSYESYSEED